MPDSSFSRLRTNHIHGVLLHDGKNFASSPQQKSWHALETAKQAGKVSKIGVSVYTPQELETVLSLHRIDIVQLPANLLDQRFLHSGLIQHLAELGVEIHLRSLFLQGLLLMDRDLRPAWADIRQIRHFDAYCRDTGASALDVAFGYLNHLPKAGCAIVGCESTAQFSQIMSAFEAGQRINIDLDDFSCDDENIILPMNWGQK